MAKGQEFDGKIFSLKHLSTHDFKIYFEGAICKVRSPQTEGKWLWAQSGGFHGDTTLRWDVDGKTIVMSYKDVEIESVFFSEGLYNHEKTVVISRRIPKRQYNKGLTTENCSISSLEDVMIGLGLIPPEHRIYAQMHGRFQWNNENMTKAIENPKYLGYFDALRQIKGGNVFARALNPEFALSQGFQGPELAVWYKDHPIGVVARPSTIRLSADEFVPEAMDCFNPFGVEVRT